MALLTGSSLLFLLLPASVCVSSRALKCLPAQWGPCPTQLPSRSAPLPPHFVHPVETRALACVLPWGAYFSPWHYLSRVLSFPVHPLFKHALHILPQWELEKGVLLGKREGFLCIYFLSVVVLSLLKSLFLALL